MASASSRLTSMRLAPRVAQPSPRTVTSSEVRPILRFSKAGIVLSPAIVRVGRCGAYSSIRGAAINRVSTPTNGTLALLERDPADKTISDLLGVTPCGGQD